MTSTESAASPDPGLAWRGYGTGNADPRFECNSALAIARALMAGERFGVFEALRDGLHTPSDVASAIAVDADTLELVLRVLVGAGYVHLQDGRYGLTADGRDLLLADSPNSRAGAVGIGRLTWRQLESLDEVLKTGQAVDMHHTLTDEAIWETYQSEMLAGARGSAQAVAAAVPVRSGATKLLDLAGSHGINGAIICRANPPMRSVVLDLPAALKSARGLARDAGIDDVVEHRAADILVDDLPADQDVAFLGNILHHFDEDQVDAVIGRVKDALVPGATIAIWEIVGADYEGSPEIFTDTTALIFRVTSNARCYKAVEYVDWLERHGFVDTQVTTFAPVHALVTARVPT